MRVGIWLFSMYSLTARDQSRTRAYAPELPPPMIPSAPGVHATSTSTGPFPRDAAPSNKRSSVTGCRPGIVRPPPHGLSRRWGYFGSTRSRIAAFDALAHSPRVKNHMERDILAPPGKLTLTVLGTKVSTDFPC